MVISIAPTAIAEHDREGTRRTRHVRFRRSPQACVAKQTVLCVGDLMLDDFVYGEVTRISPEAPTPVLAVARSEVEIGGAGNVARNIAALGARCIFVGLIGKDEAGRTLTDALGQAQRLGRSPSGHRAGRQTTRKVRFVSEHHSAHLMRADWETAAAGERGKRDRQLSPTPKRRCRSAGAVVLSDYAKGVLTPRVIRAIIDRARQARQTGRGRSERSRLQRLPRRDADHAEPAGTGRGRASAGRRPKPRSPRRRPSSRASSIAKPFWSRAARRA